MTVPASPPLVIAIDGPAASGKGTLARRLARAYGLPHLDTGLLYRGTARGVLRAGRSLDDEAAAIAAAQGLNLAALDEAALRGKAMGEAASVVAAMPSVRAALVAVQRAFAARAEGAVLDGRDIGTAIVPGAPAKIFVTAEAETRARRRHLELRGRGETIALADVLADIRRRDERDSSRVAAPLRQADDALLLDTTALDIEAAFAEARRLVALCLERGAERRASAG